MISNRVRRIVSCNKGFTLAELLIVIVVLGMVTFIAGLELRSLNTNSKMDGAVRQVSRSLEDGYSIAQLEKVTVTIKFYSSSDGDPNKRNRYEVLRNGESTKPPIGISYAKVGNSYYYMLLEGSSQPAIVSAVTVILKPIGCTTRSVDESSAPVPVVSPTSIKLSYTGISDKTITVNSEGKVSP